MNTVKPIETSIGTPSGRDGFYVDQLVQANTKLAFEGEINGASTHDKEQATLWIRYKLQFVNVAAFDAREVDISNWEEESSFCEIGSSQWLVDLDLSESHHHYVLSTYDMDYQIAATHYEIEIIGQRKG